MDKELYKEVQSYPEEQFVVLLKEILVNYAYIDQLEWGFTRHLLRNTVYASIIDAEAIKNSLGCWMGCSSLIIRKAYNMLLNYAADKRVFGALIAKSGCGLILVPVLKEADTFRIYSDCSKVRKIDISRCLADYLQWKKELLRR